MESGNNLLKKGIDTFSTVTIQPGDTAEILFVSSKMGVMLSHKAIISNVEGLYDTFEFDRTPEPGQETVLNRAQSSEQKRTKKLMMIFPYSHLYPSLFGILMPLMAGWTVITTATGRMDRILKMVKETEPNYIVLVPLLLDRLYLRLKGRILTKKRSLESLGLQNLEWIFVAGSKCPEDLIDRVEQLNLKVLEGYGVSEMAPFITINTPQHHCHGSVGIRLKNVEIKIQHPDEHGNGEVLAKGPNMMCGYYNGEDSGKANGKERLDDNREPLTEGIVGEGGIYVDEKGWLHTGDIGKIDAQGFLHITGRARNIIVSKGGTNIYPREIENLLIKSPFIREAKVIPLWNEASGEYPFALIRPNRETIKSTETEKINTVITQELENLTGQIASYKIPKGFQLVNETSMEQTEKSHRFMFKDHYLV